MIKIIQSYDVKASVIAINSDESSVYFTDCEGNLHAVNKTNWNITTDSLVPDTQTALHRFQKGSAFSQNGHVAYSMQENGSCALCLKISTIEQEIKDSDNTIYDKAIVIHGNDQKAEVVSFCGEKGEYLFTGGNDGRVYMCSSENGKILMSLKPKPEYISSIAVDERGGFVAYGAFDKSLTILNLRHQKEHLNTFLGDVIEHSFFYNDSKYFYAIGRDGNSYIYDFKTGTMSKKALFVSWPNCCIVDASQRFAIVGARNGTIYVVKLSDNSIYSSFKLDQKGISSLHIKDENLFIGFENGWMYVINMHAYIDNFSQALTVKDFKNAKRCLDKNQLLTIHPMSEMFQEAWEDMLKEIINQFSTGNSASAMEFAEPFLSDEKHKKEFNALLQKQKEFENFSILVQKKEFFDAYGMLQKAPYLSKTDSARKLELYFLKNFAEAKKMISADSLRNITKAQELLKPFSLIPEKKEMINSLFKNYEIYLKADSMIKEKRFKEYFILTAEFKFLTAEDIYTKVCSLAESSIFKIKNLVKEGKYQEAFNGIKQIIVFLPYKEQLMRIAQEIQLKQKFLELIKNNNILEIYELVEKHTELESLPEFIRYDKTFDDALSKAMLYVANGEIKMVQQILFPYIKVAVFKAKIRECVRQASFNKLSVLLKENSISSAKTVALYYLREFGKDKEYERLLKTHGLNYENI